MSTDPFETAPWNFPISNRRTLSCLSLQVTITDPQTLRVRLAISLCKSLMQLNYREMREMTNLLNPLNYNDSLELANSLDLLNSVVQTESGEHVQYSGSPEHYLYSGSANILVGCIDENQNTGDLSDLRNEKGSTANAALWYHSPDDIGSVHYKIVVVQKKNYKSFVGQPMGSSFAFLRCRRLISPSIAEEINCPVLSPGSLTCSMPAMRSCAIRAVTDCDLAFFGPVAIHLSYNSWCKTIYTDLFLLKGLTCKTPDCYCLSYTLGVLKVDLAKPGSVTSTYRASNHNVTRTYTMAYSHSTQTHPEKHLWRFLALDRADMNAIPRRVSVEAPTEHDARLVLAPYFILSLAARLPAQGVCNV